MATCLCLSQHHQHYQQHHQHPSSSSSSFSSPKNEVDIWVARDNQTLTSYSYSYKYSCTPHSSSALQDHPHDATAPFIITSGPVAVSTYITAMSCCPHNHNTNHNHTNHDHNSNNSLLAAGCSDGSLRFYRISTNPNPTTTPTTTTHTTPNHYSHIMALEKKIPNAHEGAMTCIQWNQDGLSLATAGEDGTLTLWSKAGNVRRSFSYAHSIYAISWGGSSNGTILYQNYQNYQESLVVAHGTTLSIVSCHDNTNHSDCLEWDIYHHHHHHYKSSSDSTHNNNNENSSSRSRSRSSSSSKSSSKGVILALDWNKTHHSILCGGEDCRYHIYNPQGVLLYVSEIHLHVITSLKWRPISHAHSCQISHEHHVFVVGTFEDVYLCDATGWKRHYHHNHKHNDNHNHSSCHGHNLLQNHGSVTCLEWNVTGTQVWGTCGDGSVWKGDLVGQCQEWGPLSATLVDPYTITVTNFANSKEFVQDVTFAR